MHFEKCDLDRTKLPTQRNVIEYLMFLRHKGTSNIGKNQSLNVYANYVSQAIIEVWQRTKIPILSQSRIRKIIVGFLKKYKNFTTHPQRYNIEDWNKLFVISLFKCFINSTRNTCTCPSMNAIPDNEKDFFF